MDRIGSPRLWSAAERAKPFEQHMDASAATAHLCRCRRRLVVIGHSFERVGVCIEAERHQIRIDPPKCRVHGCIAMA